VALATALVACQPARHVPRLTAKADVVGGQVFDQEDFSSYTDAWSDQTDDFQRRFGVGLSMDSISADGLVQGARARLVAGRDRVIRSFGDSSFGDSSFGEQPRWQRGPDVALYALGAYIGHHGGNGGGEAGFSFLGSFEHGLAVPAPWVKILWGEVGQSWWVLDLGPDDPLFFTNIIGFGRRARSGDLEVGFGSPSTGTSPSMTGSPSRGRAWGRGSTWRSRSATWCFRWRACWRARGWWCRR
jgi:hypothetical protein